jgi:hypothetical protein
MHITRAFSVICLCGGLIAISGLPGHAQISSGGTSAGVTEGLQGQTGSSKTQGVPGSGWDPNDKEKAKTLTLDDLKKDVEQTHGGASAVAAEKLKEKSIQQSNTDRKNK